MRSVSFQLNLSSTGLPLRQSIKTDMGKLFDNSNLLARTKRSQLVHIAWLITILIYHPWPTPLCAGCNVPNVIAAHKGRVHE